MFDSTVPENFESWTRFLDVYYEPIRAALRCFRTSAPTAPTT